VATGITSRFDADTAVDAAGTLAEVDGGWSGYLGAHGGYVAAIALRGLVAAVGDARLRPRSLTVHLLEPVAAGTIELEPRVERRGRGSSTATVRLRQAGRTVAVATGALGADRPGIEHMALAMPSVPPPEACEPLGGRPVPQAGMSQYVEHRPAAAPLPFAGSDRAEILVWMRLAEDRDVDDLAATFLADAAVPALYATLTSYVAMPTTDLTLHYGARPAAASPWVLGVFRTRRAADGYALEDGELWAPDGTLLASARQLRRVLA